MARRNPEEPLPDSPTAWFAVLERAVRTGDAKLERRARQELARLGVSVSLPAIPGPARAPEGRS